MKRNLLTVLICLVGIIAKAQQTKSIKILSSLERTPIEKVTVYNTTTGNVVTTSNQGIASIEGKQGDSILINHATYHPIHTVFESLPEVIYLEFYLVELPELVLIKEVKQQSYTLNKLPVDNLDLPVTTNGVSQELMIQRNATDLGEATKSATGVRPINRYGGFQTFRIRGFNNFVLLNDGVRDERHNLSTSAPSTNLANVERIEVLKGPASVLFGHSALGGIINVVHKKPSATQMGDFKITYGSFDTYNMSIGLGGPINERLQYRADFGMTRSNGWRDYGIATNNGSLTLNYLLSDRDVITVSLQANKDQYDTDTGLPVDENGSLVSGMEPETRYNDPQDYLKHKRLDVQLKYKHEFSESLRLTNLFSWSNDDINYLSTEWLTFNATKDSLKRAFPFYFNHTTNTTQNQLDLSYSFETGALKHHAVVGHSLSLLHRKTFGGGVEGPGTFTTVSIQNPTLNQGHIESVDNNVRAREEFVNGFYVQDWISLSEKLKVLLGLRYDAFSGTYYRDELNADRSIKASGKQTTIPSSALTYRGGLVFKPREDMSVFASYSNYFKPSRTISPSNQVFDPEKGFQTEAGIKWEKSGLLAATLSTFYILKNNIVERNTANVYNQIGEAESKGVEIDLDYRPIKGLFIKAGYAFTHTNIRSFDEEALQATKAGNKLRFAPEHLANAWVSYTLSKGTLKGLGIGAGANLVSENFTNSSNTYKLPSYVIVDASIFYQAKRTRLAFNAYNLGDKLYFTDAIYDYQFFPGMKRNYKLSISHSF